MTNQKRRQWTVEEKLQIIEEARQTTTLDVQIRVLEQTLCNHE